MEDSSLCYIVVGTSAYSLSHVRLFAIPRTVARQPPLSTGFSRQEHWSGLPRPPPGDLPDPGIEPSSPAFSYLSEIYECV